PQVGLHLDGQLGGLLVLDAVFLQVLGAGIVLDEAARWFLLPGPALLLALLVVSGLVLDAELGDSTEEAAHAGRRLALVAALGPFGVGSAVVGFGECPLATARLENDRPLLRLLHAQVFNVCGVRADQVAGAEVVDLTEDALDTRAGQSHWGF